MRPIHASIPSRSNSSDGSHLIPASKSGSKSPNAARLRNTRELRKETRDPDRLRERCRAAVVARGGAGLVDAPDGTIAVVHPGAEGTPPFPGLYSSCGGLLLEATAAFASAVAVGAPRRETDSRRQGLGLEDESARELRRRRCPGRRRAGDEREQNGKQKERKRERLEDSGRRSPSSPPAPDDSFLQLIVPLLSRRYRGTSVEEIPRDFFTA